MKVTDLQRFSSKPRNDGRIFHQLAQHAGATLRRLVEQDLLALPGRWQRLAREFPRFELEQLLNRLLERCLQTRHDLRWSHGLEAHCERILGVLNERHDTL